MLSFYEILRDVVIKIEQLQETLNQLRGIIRRAIEENDSLKTVICEKSKSVKVINDASE